MLQFLATEAGGHLDLMGELRGYAIVFFSVGLFCGSIYLVLATDIGSRMGFMVSFASLTGFLAMLGLIWFTNLTPLNALHGPPPHWVVEEIVDDPGQAEIDEVRNIKEEGVVLDAAQQGEVKATVDAAVTAEGEFQLFSNAADYVVIEAEKIGGGSLPFFRHRPLYSVMHIQGAKDVTPLPGAAPPPPEADPAQPAKYVVLRRDLGALRQPPVVMTVAFSILFALSLYVMHNMERAQQKAARADLEPTPAPA
ncbi:MAG TPA: hypothetical protein VFS16_13455 [Acidimicrobiia bacterium]|nr:hypothetical protein [Acidimicrobiia bacterium]